MEKIYHHGIKYVIKELLESKNTKTVIILLLIEFALFCFAVYKGLGMNYFIITGFIMLFTIISCLIVFYIRADQYLLVAVILLLNLGFIVQEIEMNGIKLSSFLFKLAVAIITAFLVGILYKYLAAFFSTDKAIYGMITVQLLLCLILYFLGTEIGNKDSQGATLTIQIMGISFTPFEIVKVLYLFVAAALLCKEQKKKVYIGKWEVCKENIFIIYTMLLSIFFILCKELGTLLIVYLIGLAMLWIFSQNRVFTAVLIILTITGITIFWLICDKLLYPMVISNEIILPGLFEKLVKRFGTALHPEKSMFDTGYQGTLQLGALTIGGLYGIDTERYRMLLPEATSDMIFANAVQTCGFFIGAVILIAFFALLKRGMVIVSNCKDTYFQGLAMAITLLFAIECMIHIGYNIVLLPITGIPLYFVSQGFTAIVTAMALISIQLVISAKIMERSEK